MIKKLVSLLLVLTFCTVGAFAADSVVHGKITSTENGRVVIQIDGESPSWVKKTPRSVSPTAPARSSPFPRRRDRRS